MEQSHSAVAAGLSARGSGLPLRKVAPFFIRFFASKYKYLVKNPDYLRGLLPLLLLLVLVLRERHHF